MVLSVIERKFQCRDVVRGWGFVSVRQLFISSQQQEMILCPSSPWIFFSLSFMLLERSRRLSTIPQTNETEGVNVLCSMKAVQTLLLLACLNVWRFLGEKMKNILLGLCFCIKFSFSYGDPSVQRQKDRKGSYVVLFLWQNMKKVPKVSDKWKRFGEWTSYTVCANYMCAVRPLQA